MKTIEILDLFLKGNESTGISEKQKSWLVSVAKKEGIKCRDDFGYTIYFAGFYVTIKHATHLASGGSYVAKRIVQGRYNLKKNYWIKFKTGSHHTACYEKTDLDHFDREKIEYEILDATGLYQ